MEGTTGLRERKKQRTREAIVEAAFELFEQRGFDGTTINDIAEAAEIAPRTFFSYFPSKDDVVFHDFEERYEMIAGWLRDRDPGTNAIDALRAGIEGMGVEVDPTEIREKKCRKQLVREKESLAALLGLGPNHVLPTGPPWRLGVETPPSHPKEEPDDIASQRQDVS